MIMKHRFGSAFHCTAYKWRVFGFRFNMLGFKNPFVSGFYILAMALLCLHLSHGVSAMFQSLGLKCACCPCLPKCLAKGAALVIFLGNSSIPMAILLGYGKEVLK